MLIKKPGDIPSSQITPEETYVNRRNFMRAGVLAATTVATGYVYRQLNAPRAVRAGRTPQLAQIATTTQSTQAVEESIAKAFRTDEKLTSFDEITHYNNF